MSIKQLIEAIEQGDAATISVLFDKLMAEKLAEAIQEHKIEIAESLFSTEQSLEEAYTASGEVYHGNNTHKFKVKYHDFPSHSAVQKQNPHLAKHHVDAIMNHFEEHGDDDMTGTLSTHGHEGTEVHITHNSGYHGESFDVFEFDEDFDPSQLDESAGSLAGLPSHVIKHLTNRNAAGQNSKVEKHVAKNISGLAGHIKDGLGKGHAVAVYVNGKVHKVVSSNNDGSYGREHFHVHNATGKDSKREVKYTRGRSGSTYRHEYQDEKYKKGEAVEKATSGMGEGSHEKDFYKNNHVEVHHISVDKERLKKAGERQANRPQMQSNYVKATDADVKDGRKVYGYGPDAQKSTGETTAGDRLSAIKDAAAIKLAKKKLGAAGNDAKSKAFEMHKELAKHIEAGDHRAVKSTLDQLHKHVQNVGLEGHDDKVKRYADTLKDLKRGWGKEYAKKDLARLRGETNEAAEIAAMFDMVIEEVESYEQGLEEAFEQLDELSKDTVKNYAKSTMRDAFHQGLTVHDYRDDDGPHDSEESDEAKFKGKKRVEGAKRAGRRLGMPDLHKDVKDIYTRGTRARNPFKKMKEIDSQIDK